MALTTAFDLIKRLATDGEFRKRLSGEDFQAKRALLAAEGFADLAADDIRKAVQPVMRHPLVEGYAADTATGITAFAGAGISGPADTAGISGPADTAGISGPADTAAISTPAIASAGFSAPAFAAPAFAAPAFSAPAFGSIFSAKASADLMPA